MTYEPTFQAQNPAISHYALGWLSCTSFATAMMIDFDTLGAKRPSGGAVRTLCKNPDGTPDRTGGTNLQQNDTAALNGWGVNLATVYRLPWADFAKKIDAGCGAILQGWYNPIANSRFDAGNGFRENHALAVPPSWKGLDPLADGRYSNVYKYHGEPYPKALLRDFAGKLNLSGDPRLYRPLGAGLVYASFTRDNVHTYHLSFLGGAFFVYTLKAGVITGRKSVTFGQPTGAPCSAPAFHSWPGHPRRSLVQITAGKLSGAYIGVASPSVKLEVVP